MSCDSEMNTVRDLIDWMASTRPDFAFLISPETGRVSTFKGLQEQAVICAGGSGNWVWSAATKLRS